MLRYHFFIFFLISFSSTAQSILSNGNAEDYYSPPSVVGDFAKCAGWDNCSSDHASPDFWHLNGWGIAQLPDGSILMDSMMPYEGGGVLGQVLYNVPSASNGYILFREYLDKELDQPMVVGETYQISIWYHSLRSSSSACNCFSMLFSTNPLVQNSVDPIITNPQITIVDTIAPVEWTYWSGTFTADSAYEYITLGNFFSNPNSQLFSSQVPDATYSSIYYTFDALNIGIPIEEESSGETSLDLSDFPNGITPNGDDINDYLIYSIPEEYTDIEFKVFNRWGNVVYETGSNTILWDGYSDKNTLVSTGTYFWTLSCYNENKKFFKSNYVWVSSD